MPQYFTCPNCGAEVPLKALACPTCGSDKETGWSDAARYIHLLPDRGDSVFDGSRSTAWQKPTLIVIAVLILTGFVASQGLTWAVVAIPAAAIAVAAGYFLMQHYSHSRWGMERKLYRQLLTKAAGNKQLAERLVAYERKRNPDSTRLQALQNAIFYYNRDRR
jgi:hypothetical protein